MNYKYISFFFLILFLQCTQKEDSSTQKNLITLIALSGTGTTSTSTTSSSTPTCSETKKFTDVQANSTYTSCTSCHSSLSHSSSYDFSTYSNAINSNGRNQVIPNNPKSSRLWVKISTGSMSDRSNTTFNDLVYCWIEKGALQ